MYFLQYCHELDEDYSFDENSNLAKQSVKGGTIISVQTKIWMALVFYLIYLGCITFIIIRVMVKLL